MLELDRTEAGGETERTISHYRALLEVSESIARLHDRFHPVCFNLESQIVYLNSGLDMFCGTVLIINTTIEALT